MTLNRCPPEICSQIFAFTCTDGGYTGRSLSAVSRYVRDTSSSYKFQSVALRNTRQTLSFASVLDGIPPHLRGVAFLFVSNDDFPINGPESDREVTRTSGWRRIFSFATSQTKVRSINADLVVDFVEAVLKILTIIAPTLRIFFISGSFEIRLPLLAPVGTRFPTLTSLTELSLNYRAQTDAVFNHYMRHFPAAFPSLTRLDISGLELPSYSCHLFGSIAKIAPSLTNLHLPAKMALNINTPFTSSPVWSPEDQNITVGLHGMLIELNGPHIYRCRNPDTECTRCRLLAMTADRRFVALEARDDYTWERN